MPDLATTRRESVPAIALRALRHPATALGVARFVGTVHKDFFALQFAVKLGLRRVPVVDVDHPLDARIPFTPERIATYLDFISFWIRPLGWIARHHGPRAFVTHGVRFLGLIDRCYREAAEVYRAGMTTTRRPRYYRGRFLAIHLFDPHLLCVPSLHVMIVVLAYTFYRRAFAELGVTGDEAADLDRELFGGAVKITETVLYIKQHSVNCIPAALYAMSRITPDAVTASEVDAFIDRLFVDAPLLAEGTDDRIRASIREVFGRLTADGRTDADWTPAVRRFLLACQQRDF